MLSTVNFPSVHQLNSIILDIAISSLLVDLVDSAKDTTSSTIISVLLHVLPTLTSMDRPASLVTLDMPGMESSVFTDVQALRFGTTIFTNALVQMENSGME